MDQTRWEQVYSSIRHAMTLGGGILVSLGVTDEVAVNDVTNNVVAGVGALAAVVGWAWGVYDKLRARRKQTVIPPATPPIM